MLISSFFCFLYCFYLKFITVKFMLRQLSHIALAATRTAYRQRTSSSQSVTRFAYTNSRLVKDYQCTTIESVATNWRRCYSVANSNGTDRTTSEVVPATAEDIEEFQEVSQETLSAEEADRLTHALAASTINLIDPDSRDMFTVDTDAQVELNDNEDPDWYLKEAQETQTEIDTARANDPDWTPRWRRSALQSLESSSDTSAASSSMLHDTATTPWSIDDTQQWLIDERAENVAVVDVRPVSEWMDWLVVAEAPTRSRLVALAEGLTRAIRQRQRRINAYRELSSTSDDDKTSTTPPSSSLSLSLETEMVWSSSVSDGHQLDSAPQIVGRDPPSDWLAVDAGDQSIHLFLPDLRAEYDLDGMWQRRLLQHAANNGSDDQQQQVDHCHSEDNKEM
ncbi:hypothetical protein BDF19DRAFT_441255 [Syncephalis fuscata]|nr:hypothetical protein BDF19DRAFT_441255 [Syncephalis fuscata]